jgi:hypothetical protein
MEGERKQQEEREKKTSYSGEDLLRFENVW